MPNNFAFPQCVVDIYPQEGGGYSLQGSLLLACNVDKKIDGNPGTFELILAPGGPLGTSVPPSWATLITPMSLAVIAMSRGEDAAVVMVGVVTVINSTQEWSTGRSTERVTRIGGMDFGYFFSMFTYYSLWYLGATGAGIDISGLGNPAAGLPQVLGSGLITGDPGDVGTAWFTKIMAGANGILANTFVQFNGAQVKFPQAVAALFETYDVTVPYGQFFVGTEGAWLDKFRLIFPFPFYEFYTATLADVLDAANVESPSRANLVTGYKFTSSGLKGVQNLSGTPCVIARKNPLPQLTINGDQLTGIDTTAWQALPLFQMRGGDASFITSEITFLESDVANFYVLNPTWMRSMFGSQNDNTIPYMFQAAAMGDAASIARYGFRPANGSFDWMTDIAGDHADGNKLSKADFLQLAATLLARFASFQQPTPLMSKALVTTNLRPDIYIGNRFRYCPLKNAPTWDHYIFGVRHRYVFGGECVTMLDLTRGLPTAVYDDSGSGGLLFQIHTGNAQRKDGQYISGNANNLPGLSVLNMGNFQDFLSNIGRVYTEAQAT